MPRRLPPLFRVALLAVAVAFAGAFALPSARARQDAAPAGGDAVADEEAARVADLEARLEKAHADLDAAEAAFDRFLFVYGRRPPPAGAPVSSADFRPPDEFEVARAIDELVAQTSFVALFEQRGELRGIAADARAQLAEPDRRGPQFTAWRANLERRAALATELQSVLDRLRDVRIETLALLRGENLFLQGSTKISRDAIEEGLTDLAHLPEWLFGRLRLLPGWFAGPGHLASLLLFLVSLLPAALATWIARRWTARHLSRLGELDLSLLPVRTTLLLANLVRVACTAGFLWLAPRLALWIIRGLPEPADDLLTGLGDYAALFWLGLGLDRELLRPDPPQRLVLKVDPATARRVGIGVKLLLCWTLIAASIQFVLTRLSYKNEGALEAIGLVYEVVTGAIVTVLMSRRVFLRSLLPSAESPLGRLLHRFVGALHTILVLLVPAIVGLQVLRFRILAGLATRFLVLALCAFPLATIIYHSVNFFLERWRNASTTRAGDDEEQLRRVAAIDDIVRFLLRGTILVLVVLALFAATGSSFESVRTFLDRPLPLLHPPEGTTPVTWWNVALAITFAIVFLRCARALKLALETLVLPLTRLERSTQYSITTLVEYSLVLLGLWIAVSQVVDVKNLGYLVAALSVGIGFGMQEIISNFVSGLILLFERPLKPGDLIEIGNGTIGTVRQLGIRATTVQTGDNAHVLVPNREFVTQRVVNYDLYDPKIRVTINVGVRSGSEPKLVRETLLAVASRDRRLMKRPAPEVLFTGFGDYSLDFRLLVFIENAQQQGKIASDLRFAIDAEFKRAGVEFSSPQRDLSFQPGSALRVVLERKRDDGRDGAVEPPKKTDG
jgi:small-conductance mechanosensitive channel